jgi:putative chitinase
MTTTDDTRRMQARLGVRPDGIAGPLTWAAFFDRVAGRPLLERGQALGKGAAAQFGPYGVTTPLRIAHWTAQASVESAGFQKLEENLNYSARRLTVVWPNRFPTLASAEPFANDPEELANKVYGGRLGNTQPGDGWKFRGRGAGLTGRANYTAAAERTGLDLINHPELAAEPEHFVHIFCDYWQQRHINPMADKNDIEEVTMAVNGGRIGLADRKAAFAKAWEIVR